MLRDAEPVRFLFAIFTGESIVLSQRITRRVLCQCISSTRNADYTNRNKYKICAERAHPPLGTLRACYSEEKKETKKLLIGHEVGNLRFLFVILSTELIDKKGDRMRW